MISNCQPSLRAITSALGTFGDSMKPKRSRTVENLSLIFSIRTRSAGLTRGVCAVSMVRITLCSCSTLLCLRLCNSAVGTKLGSLVKKTAVPLTMCGGRFSRLLIRSASGTSIRRVFMVRIAEPRRQVQIMTAMAKPNNSGTQAPSSSLRRLALKNVMSTTTNGTISAAAVGDHGGGDGDAVGGREAARSAEQQHQQQYTDQQQPVDARQIDLPGMRLRGVADLEARQQAELHRLAGQRIRARNHRL